MQFKIGNQKIGTNNPVFIVAEISGNHNQNYNTARSLIDAAYLAGANAVKLQTYTPDTLTIDSNNKWFKIKSGPWEGKTLYDLYKKTYTPWEWHASLKKYAEKKGLIFFSTPFDITAVDFLEKLNVQCYKIASFEINDIELLKKVGKTKKPVIVSRGLATVPEIRFAIQTLKKSGTKHLAILHCISSYPAKLEEMNIATIPDIKKRFKVISGLSDHSLGIIAPIAATALGASIIEKHIIISRKKGGPDSKFSIEPEEFKQMVKSIRDTEKVIGKPTYTSKKNELKQIIFKRSLFAVLNIKKGEKFTRKNIKSIRPGYGLSPKYIDKIIGKKAKRNIKAGTPISKNLIQK